MQTLERFEDACSKSGVEYTIEVYSKQVNRCHGFIFREIRKIIEYYAILNIQVGNKKIGSGYYVYEKAYGPDGDSSCFIFPHKNTNNISPVTFESKEQAKEKLIREVLNFYGVYEDIRVE